MTQQTSTPPNSKKELFLTAGIIAALLLILGGTFFFFHAYANESPTPVPEEPVETQLAEEKDFIEPFANVRISARAAYVLDLNSGEVLYEKNAYEPLPLASLTKVATALTATQLLDESELVRIDWKHLEVEGDDSLIPGEHFKLHDLLNFTLVTSSNDGAHALASVAGTFATQTPTSTPVSAFVDHMNYLAKDIGMKDTRFFNETGLDENEALKEPGAIGSAKDVATLFAYVLENEPKILEATRADTLTVLSREGFEHHLQNTNEIVGDLPNILGSKTGYTNTAGGNLAVVIDPALNTPVVIVVLGSSKDGRFYDVDRLARATLDHFRVR